MARLEQILTAGRPWGFDGDGKLFRLVSEAHRIRLAHLFDPPNLDFRSPPSDWLRNPEVP